MKQLKQHTFLFFSFLSAFALSTLSSCSFSDTCGYTGNINILMDYEEYWKGMEKPDEYKIVFKTKSSTDNEKLLGDTTYTDMPSVNTDILVYNKPQGVEFTDNDREVHLPTHFDGNVRYTEEAPMITVYHGNTTVPIEETVRHIVSPKPIVKEIDLTIHVEKDGDVDEVVGISSYLSGINTAYDLHKNEPIHSKGTVKIGLSRVQGISQEQYRHKFYVFGVNTPKEGVEHVAKKLLISVKFKDGSVKTKEIDISEQLDLLNTDRFKCEVRVRITALSVDLTLIRWGQGSWGNAVLD